MKANIISKEGNKAKFSLVFTAEEFENAVVDAYKKNKDRFQIDGFRKGKAPRKIIENYYGEGIFYDEAINGLLQENYPAAIDDLDLEVIDSPDLTLEELEKGKEVTVTAVVELFPEVEVKDYIGVEVEGIEHKITDADVDAELARIQKQNARMETITDRKSKEGDSVIMDFVGSVDGEEFEGGAGENYELKLGSGQFIPGFEEQLVDKEAGEDVDVIVTFPDEYHAENLAGKEALFKCTIHEIKCEILPEIDDDLASDTSEFETLKELKEDIKKRLQKNADDNAENMIKDAIIAKVYDANEVDAPKAMVEEETDRMLNDMAQQMAYQGLDINQYMQYVGQTVDDLRANAREDAERRVKTRIILRGIINKEKIEASAEDIEKELELIAASYGQTADQVREAIGEESMKVFKQDVQIKKAIDFLYDKAKIKKPEKKAAPKKEDKKDDEKKDSKKAAPKKAAKDE